MRPRVPGSTAAQTISVSPGWRLRRPFARGLKRGKGCPRASQRYSASIHLPDVYSTLRDIGSRVHRERRSWRPRRRKRKRAKSLCTLADLIGCSHVGRGYHSEHWSDRAGHADPISFSLAGACSKACGRPVQQGCGTNGSRHNGPMTPPSVAPVPLGFITKERAPYALIAVIFPASEKSPELRAGGAFRIWRPAKVQAARSGRRR
jgi:hypothetical protein